MEAVTSGSIGVETVGKFFLHDNGAYTFVINGIDDLNHYCLEMAIPDNEREGLKDLYDQAKYQKLEKEKTDGETHSLELKEELFATEYDIEIRPRGMQSYSELFKQDQIMKVAQYLVTSPNMNRYEVDKEVIKSSGLSPDKLLKTEDKIKQEQMAAMGQMQAEQGQSGQPVQQGQPGQPQPEQGQPGMGMPPELTAAIQSAGKSQPTPNPTQ
jgi:hypothetical protein